jgi:hypothetical protein
MKKLKILTEEQLQSLPTKRILAYLGRLHQCHDHKNDEIYGSYDTGEVTKDSETWKSLYALVKRVLSGREHVK